MLTSSTIRKRKDSGRWQAIIRQKQNGNWKQVDSETFSKKIEADQWATKKKAEWQKKQSSDYDYMTVGQLKELYLDYKKHKVKHSTYLTERSAIINADWFDDRLISDIKPHEFQEVNNTKPPSHIKYMRLFFTYLIEELDMDIKNKFESKQPAKKSKTFIVYEDDLKNILDLIDKEYIKLSIKILFFTGMRISELAGLTFESIQDNQIVINKQWIKRPNGFTSLKSKNSYRTIPINPKLQKDIYQWVKSQKVVNINKRIFDDNWIANTIGRELRNKLKNTQYNGLTCHDFRHSFITRLIENGVDPITVAYLAGDKIDTIITKYVHTTSQTKQNAIKAVNNM